MPELADAHSSAADDGQRDTIERIYDALNSYGGTIGLLSVGLLRSGLIPRWVGVGAVVSAVAPALGVVELFGLGRARSSFLVDSGVPAGVARRP